jgi:hypothetical protein
MDPVLLLLLGGRRDLNGRRHDQRGTEKGQDGLSHGKSPFIRVLPWRQKLSRCFNTLLPEVGSAPATANHEAASKFVGQRKSAVKYSAGAWTCFLLAAAQLYGLPFADPVQCDIRSACERKPMKKLIFAILLVASPAWAQTKLLPKSTTARADPCAPIGRTADGKLVYSMKCENLPVPPPPPQAEIREAPQPPPQAEVQRSGIFGWSYEVKRPDQ